MNTDERYMRRALQLARQGGGHVSPNPMVGAVVVHDGKIVGEGFHRLHGHAHAEVNAIRSVADKRVLPQSTIYVTLEPCSHYGKTPPCALMLIEKKIKRVVVGCLDPFAKVSGRGVAMLREAGVDVVVGVLEQECRELNSRFMSAHTRQSPHVLLKWAQSSDGFMAAENGRVTFSTPLSQVLMHRCRSLVDAIVVGARTVEIDDPSLTTRLWPGRSPLRVVLDANNSIPATCRLLNDGGPTLVLNGTKDERRGNVEWIKATTSHPQEWLSLLYRRGITSVMVEGGAAVLNAMVAAGAWDEMRVEIAHAVPGSGVAAPHVDMKNATVTTVDGNKIFEIRRG